MSCAEWRHSVFVCLSLVLAGTSDGAHIGAHNSGTFTLQALADGTVWAWGNNASAQLGDSTFINHAIPQPVTGITSVTAVAAGGSHSLALKAD